MIPARGGSKGVPGKNVAPVGGVPLVARAVRSAVRAGMVDEVYVSTDDRAIAEAATAAGGNVIWRPDALAGDTASSEAALLHACEQIEAASETVPDVLVFIQATSPFIAPGDLDRGIARILDGELDSVFSAVETFEFLWELRGDEAFGINHDRSYRPRRQDREPHFRESGAFYIMRWAGFREAEYRFFGRVGIQTVDERGSIEIDSPAELELSRAIAPLLDHFDRFPPSVSGLVMDFDGVHTDDHVYVDSTGTESVRASRSDGLGIGMLRKTGLRMLILSKERNPVVTARAQKLGVPVIQGIDDKDRILREWADAEGMALEDLVYVGNDVNDLPAMGIVGWPVAPADAHPAARAAARLVLQRPGGSGALRELAEMLLGMEKGETND